MAAEPSGDRSAAVAVAAAVAAAADRAAVGEATQHCYGTLVAAVVVAVVLVAFDCLRFVATFAGSHHCCCSCSCCCCAVGHGFRSFLVVDNVVGIVLY